jgi:hypothetical protein
VRLPVLYLVKSEIEVQIYCNYYYYYCRYQYTNCGTKYWLSDSIFEDITQRMIMKLLWCKIFRLLERQESV